MPEPLMPEPLMNSAPGPAALEQKLINALTAQRAIYTELAALAKKQSDYVNSYDTENLMAVLGARSRLLDQIAPLDRDLQPYKECWQQTLEKCGMDARGVITMLLTQVRQLLADILERDETDKEILVRQKQEVAGQIRHTVTGTQVTRAYGARPRPNRAQFEA